MRSLGTLLKVAQRRLDELGIEAATVGAEVSDLQNRENVIRAREQTELANAARDPMFAAMLPAYRMRVKAQLADVEVQISAKQKALEAVRQKLSEAYIEKSKFEQLLDQAQIRAATERATREQAQLDEVAINRAGR